MTKLLNLDEIKNTRDVTFGGKTRKIRSMSVGEFIDNTDFDKNLKEAKSAIEQTKLLINHILTVIDDTTEEDLLSLDMDQLSMLLRYVRGDDLSDEIEAEEVPNEPAKKTRRKPK